MPIRCRSALSRNHGLKALWLVTVLGVLLAGIPRWEQHQHSVTDHGHAHHGLAGNRDDAPSQDEGDVGVVIEHFHVAPSIYAARIEAVLPSVEPLAVSVDVFPSTDWTALVNCWPPPHRPPIA